MKRKTIRTIILFATISVIGIVGTQYFWVKKAFNMQERQFNDRVIIALTSVTEKILSLNRDSSYIPEPVQQVSTNYFVVKINDTLHPYLLESLLKEEFVNRNLQQDFEYGIYDCFTDTIVFGKHVSFKDDEASEQGIYAQKRWKRDGHYFGVYFPNKTVELLGNMGIWIFSSAILLVVIVFFSYTMMVILKQKRLSEIKTDFINNMTHELKTPISTISLSSEVLLSKDIIKNPERLNRYAKIIHNENQRLKKQVEKVLQISTLEEGQIKLTRNKVDLHELIREASEVYRLSIEDRKGTIKLLLNAAASTVFADPLHLTNVIYNLLDNANKYSQDAPKILVQTENQDKGIVLTFSDQGIGMDSQVIQHIFEKFYRVPTGNIHNVKGFGLGLYYVKLIIEAHGGQIRASSEPKKGSTFKLSLPLYAEKNSIPTS